MQLADQAEVDVQEPVVVEVAEEVLAVRVGLDQRVRSSSAASSANRPCGLVTETGPSAERVVEIEGQSVQGVTLGHLSSCQCGNTLRRTLQQAADLA